MANPIGWFEIYVDDMQRAIAFYQMVLGTRLEALSNPVESEIEMWTFPANQEQYGATGALVKADGMTPGGNSVMVYFNCEDCAEEESRVSAAGGEVQQSKMSIGEYGFCSIAVDTEGNMFGLHSHK